MRWLKCVPQPCSEQRRWCYVPRLPAPATVYNCSEEGAIYLSLSEEQRNVRMPWVGTTAECSSSLGWVCRPPSSLPTSAQSAGTRHFYERVEQCKPLWSSLQQACR